MSNKYKCALCDDPRMSKDELIDHIDRHHRDEIPSGWSAGRFAFKMIYGKDHGTCVVCKSPTEWNEERCKYQRICKNPKCKEALRKAAVENHIRVYHCETLLNDPQQQEKMLRGRHISGEYTFKDGGKIGYVGSFEKKFLEFMDKVLECKSSDIMEPGPVLDYRYKNETHKWITDFLYIPYNLIIEVKDGGNNPNNRAMPDSRDRQVYKEKMITSLGTFNYLRLTDNNFTQLLRIFSDMKMQMIDDTLDNQKVVIHINEDAILEDGTLSTFEEIKKQVMLDPKFPKLKKKGIDIDDAIKKVIGIADKVGLEVGPICSLLVYAFYLAEIDLLISLIIKSFEIPATIVASITKYIADKTRNVKKKPNILPIQTDHLPKDYKMLCINTHIFNGLIGSASLSAFIAGVLKVSDPKTLFFKEWWSMFTICLVLLFIDQWDARDFVIVDSKYKFKDDVPSMGTTSETKKLSRETNVLACNDGVVIWTSNYKYRDNKQMMAWLKFNTSTAGNHVIVMHDAGSYSLYAHLQTDSIKVKVGDVVEQGQILGKVGSTGNSTEEHLHFEMSFTSPITPLLNFGKPLTNFNYEAHEMSLLKFYTNPSKYNDEVNDSETTYKSFKNEHLPAIAFVK